MRCGPFLVMLTLLVGTAPARAQDSPGIIPMPKQDAKQARSPSSTKRSPRNRRSLNLPQSNRKPSHHEQSRSRRPAGARRPANRAWSRMPSRGVRPRPRSPLVSEARADSKTRTAPKRPATRQKRRRTPTCFGSRASERQKIKAALLWAGDYTGASGGEDAMLGAIKNFQKRHKAKITGVLTPSERARPDRGRQGARGGIRLERGGRPGDRHPYRPAEQDGAQGARRRARHALVLGAWRGAGRDLPHQGARAQARRAVRAQKKEPATRRVETSVLHDDDFFISGMQGLKMFSVRAKMRDGEVRGVTMLYDQMMEGIVAPVTAAMAARSRLSPSAARPTPRWRSRWNTATDWW